MSIEAEKGMCRHQERQERLLIAIWDAWKDGRVLTVRTMQQHTGHRSKAGVHSMLQTLVNHDWLRREVVTAGASRYGMEMHKYLPGPRFAGVANGRPLRVIDDEDQFAPTRVAKYDRRGVLFEATA